MREPDRDPALDRLQALEARLDKQGGGCCDETVTRDRVRLPPGVTPPSGK
jgi:hypothetical protein